MPLLSPPKKQWSETRKRWNGVGLGALSFLGQFVHLGALRGVGYSLMPMIVSLIGACGLRIVWIFTAFQIHRSLWMLYISYPITWIITGGVHILCCILVRRKQLQTVKNR